MRSRAADAGASSIAVAMTLVALPIAVAAIRLLSSGFTATGDIAATELRVRDVFSHPTAYGAYTRFGWHHPGPTEPLTSVSDLQRFEAIRETD